MKSLSLDFYGPLASGRMLLVVNDLCTKFPVVAEVASTSAADTLPALDQIFSDYGVPEELKSDNGASFSGVSFADFCTHVGVKHRRITPLFPQANGLSENLMRNMKKVVANSFFGGTDFKAELNRFLRSYRSTPHASTGFAPASLLFREPNMCRLPAVRRSVAPDADMAEARLNDANAKSAMKLYADKRRQVTQFRSRRHGLARRDAGKEAAQQKAPPLQRQSALDQSHQGHDDNGGEAEWKRPHAERSLLQKMHDESSRLERGRGGRRRGDGTGVDAINRPH